MRQLLLLLLLVSPIGSGDAALGQSSASSARAAAPQQNAAVITFNAAVLNTNEAQKEFADLQKKFAPREAHLKALNDEVESLKKQLEAAGDKLSQQERASRLQTLDTRNKQLQREAEDYRNDSQTESQQAFQTVAQKVYAFLQDFAKRHGYSYVIERGSADSPIVWYAANEADITAQVTSAYNAQTAEPHPASR